MKAICDALRGCKPLEEICVGAVALWLRTTLKNGRWNIEFQRPFFRPKMLKLPVPTMILIRRIFWASLALVALAFAVVWWQLAASSRLAADDFCALQQVREHGQLGAVLWWRENWAGRWASQGIIGLFVAQLWPHAVLQSYCWFAFAACFSSLWLLLGRVAAQAQWSWNRWQCAILAGAALAVFYEMMPERAQLWFWLSGSVTHLLPLAFGFLGAAMLWKTYPKLWESAVAAACGLLVAGTSEAALVTVGLLWIGALVCSARYERESLAVRAWPLLGLVVGAAITFSAPGLWLRANAESKTAAPGAFKLALAFGHTYRALVETNLSALLAVFAIGLVLGLSVRDDADTNNSGRKAPSFWWAIGLFGLSVAVQAPGIWAFKGHAPPRSWAPCVVLLLWALASAGWGAAWKLPRQPAATAGATGFCALACLALLPLFWHLQTVEIPLARRAASQFDAHYVLMLDQKRNGRRETLTLGRLPRADAVLLGEPMTTTDDWISECLRDGLDLPYDVRRDR